MKGPGTSALLQKRLAQKVWTIVLRHTHTHTHTHLLLKQETVSGSGISWAVCKSAPHSRQITMPALHHSVFLQTGCPSCHPTNSVKALKAHYSSSLLLLWYPKWTKPTLKPRFFQSLPHQQNLGLYWQFPVLSVCLSTVFSVANFQNFIIGDFFLDIMVDFRASVMWKCLLDLIDRLFMPCYTCNAEAKINTTHS